MLTTLRRGDRGEAVQRWQIFLLGQGFDPKGTDSVFGKDTVAATLAFQKKRRIPETGIVDDATYGAAGISGFVLAEDTASGNTSPNWPPRPTDVGPTNAETRDTDFGWYDFRHRPSPDDYEHIEILGTWESDNIVRIPVPELAKALGRTTARASVHRKVEAQFLAIWRAWNDAGLLDRVLTWEGAFNSRFIRGGAAPENVRTKNRDKLSNHAWGTAFDINYAANKLGQMPALLGQKGCVRELVEIANAHGFFWGGHFRNRPDGMHFEWARSARLNRRGHRR